LQHSLIGTQQVTLAPALGSFHWQLVVVVVVAAAVALMLPIKIPFMPS